MGLFDLFKANRGTGKGPDQAGGSLDPGTIVIVSGLPRSGTSMMMKMLEAGGLDPLIDNVRTADDDNPKGYYEFERVKALDKGDTEWLPMAQGKVVKVISALLKYLPSEYRYKVIFMRRRLEENIESQKKMLVNRGEDTEAVSDEELGALLEKHLRQIDTFLNSQPNIDLLYVPYHEMVQDPHANISMVNAFLGNALDAGKMTEVVDAKLYRNRA
ncbi:MAG: sulfotransferase family protein [Planctomycetes bacterium]|nr:sulfotransferase family protein [Planctomycetota bacterium]NOG55052.1 sulfotransferase family protein [Planctomycetota bacterium]